MHVKNVIQAVALTNIASASLTGSYQAINPLGLINPCTIVRLISTSSTAVTISYDGITDNDVLPAGATLQLLLTSNGLPPDITCALPIGTIVYVKGTAGTGNIYLAGYYQPK